VVTAWKARIGYLSPSVFEIPSDWSDILPPGFTLVATGLNVESHTPEQFNKAIDRLESALSVFVAEEVDVLLLIGIAIATQRGYVGEKDVVSALTRRLGIPVTSALSANADALNHLGAKKIVIATAYKDEINDKVRRYFEEAGFQVAGIRGLNVGRPIDQVKLPEEASYNVASNIFREHSDADAILIHGRWRSLANAERLEKETGRPVVASVAASLWWILKTLGMKLPIQGCGQLLR
jgi:arylmalonate decarboxylase